MRVLLVVHGFPPTSMGGTEIYTHDLARALHAHGRDDIFVLAREADPRKAEYAIRTENRDGIHVTFVNNTFRACRSLEETYRNPPIRTIAARMLDEIRPDVVHVQHLTCLSTDIVSECAARRIPTIFTLNDYWLICHRGQLFNVEYERCEGPYPHGCSTCTSASASESQRDSALRLEHMREMCAKVDRFLAPSRTLQQRFLTFGIEPHRMTLQQQGINQAGFARVARTSDERLRIAFMGSLIVSKAPHVLIEAFDGLPGGTASLHLFGAYAPYHGDDRYQQTLTGALTRGGHGCGPVSHDRIPEVLASVDVVVVPSVWIENAPFVIRESFAAGVPVVASNLGGMAEMVTDGVSGLLFEAGNPNDLRRCLQRLIDEPELLHRLRRSIPPVKTIEDDAAWTRAIYENADATMSRP